ncbi:hypothetical protein [Lentibacillus saliphilus]|uniref:hypothetical protein n=1 Tax=Lentibacillus saliphilus TaxID=2737028 RepID=UPI001C30D4BC|nr:hypothetical protein [Lentibacillus saliphilus]
MKITAMLGGLLGVFFSLVAMLFAVVDDSYTFGNFGLLGILGGIIAIIASFQLAKNRIAPFLLLVAILLGVYGLSYLYILAALLMAIPLVYYTFKYQTGKV